MAKVQISEAREIKELIEKVKILEEQNKYKDEQLKKYAERSRIVCPFSNRHCAKHMCILYFEDDCSLVKMVKFLKERKEG